MATVDGAWQPGIGDPTLLGWVTVAAFCGAAWVCWRQHGRSWQAFWLWLALALALLGIKKQLDLQSALTAMAAGWPKPRAGMRRGTASRSSSSEPSAWLDSRCWRCWRCW